MINLFGKEFQEAINSKKFESVLQDTETFKDAYIKDMKKLIQQVEEKKVVKEVGENYEKLKATIKNAQTILIKKHVLK